MRAVDGKLIKVHNQRIIILAITKPSNHLPVAALNSRRKVRTYRVYCGEVTRI